MNRLRVISLICVLLVGGLPAVHHVQGSPKMERQVSVMTFNVGTLNSKGPEMGRVTEILKKYGSTDFLVLQELPGEQQAHSIARELNDANFVYAPYSSSVPGGLAIFSHHPIKLVKTFPLNYGSLAAEADVGGEKVLLLSVHLERVKGFRIEETGIELSWKKALMLFNEEMREESSRSRAVDEILTWIASQTYGKVIVAGDFNTVPFSKSIRKMGVGFKDALWPSLQYLSGSYREIPLPVEPRIDYVFHSPGLKCVSARVIKESAGDHYPVRAVFDMASMGRG